MSEEREIQANSALPLDDFLIRRKEVSSDAKICYARLAQFASLDMSAHISRETLAELVGLSKNQVDYCLRELKKHRLIRWKKAGFQGANVFFFLYHEWMDQKATGLVLFDKNQQCLKFPNIEYEAKVKEFQTLGEKTNEITNVGEKRTLDLSLLSSLSIKRDLKKEVSEIVGKINSLSGKHYKATSKNIVKFLIARMEEDEDASLENCLLVVEHRWAKWGEDEKMFESFNPVTIFRKANFEKYLVEAQAARDGAGEWEPPEVRAARK